MGWKTTGSPMVRQERGHWVVRVDGFDTEAGRSRPRQLGTYAGASDLRAIADVLGHSPDMLMKTYARSEASDDALSEQH